MKKLLTISLMTSLLVGCVQNGSKSIETITVPHTEQQQAAQGGTAAQDETATQDGTATQGKTTAQTNVQDVLSEKDVAFKVVRETEILDDLENLDQFIQDMNKHRIYAYINNHVNPAAILECKTVSKDGVVKTITEFEQTPEYAEAYAEVEVKGNSFENRFKCKVTADNGDVLAEKDVALRRDILVKPTKGNQVTIEEVGLAKGSNKVGALILEKGTLVTGGESFGVVADYFIANEGTSILTHSSKTITAVENHPGASGGEITIYAKKSVGRLEVILQGQNAGANTEVIKTYENFNPFNINTCVNSVGQTIPHTFSTVGSPGLNGGSAGIFNLRSDILKLDWNVTKIAGKGGSGGKNYNPASRIEVRYLKEKHKILVPAFHEKINKLYQPGASFPDITGSVVCASRNLSEGVESCRPRQEFTPKVCTYAYLNEYNLQVMIKQQSLNSPTIGPRGQDGSTSEKSCAYEGQDPIGLCF